MKRKPVDYEEEKALHERAKRELAELRLQKARGEVYEAKIVERVMIDMLTRFRVRLESLPHKLATMIEGKPRDEIDAILTAEIYDCLSELARYDPSLFASEIMDEEDD